MVKRNSSNYFLFLTLLIIYSTINQINAKQLYTDPPNTMGSQYMGIGSTFGRWVDGRVPIVYNPAGAPGKFANQQQMLKIIHEAFAEWENISGIHFDFLGVTNDELENDQDNRVVIAWRYLEGAAGRAGPTYSNKDYYTLGYFTYVDGTVELHSDPKDTENWSWWSIKTTLVHEFGHLIGLGHSDNPFSILHADYDNQKTFMDFNLPLMQDDIEAAQALYGWPENFIPPAVFSPPSNDWNASISDDFYFISESYKNTNHRITNITDATVVSDKDYLWLNFDFQNFPIGNVQFITVTPLGYIHYQYTSPLNIKNGIWSISVGRASQIKAFPGIWRIYTISDNKTLFSRSIEVNTSQPEWNRPPKATLSLSKTREDAPLTVTATLHDIIDPEDNKTSVIWHVPGEGETKVQDVKAQTSKIINFPRPGTYTIYVEINDDAPRYEGAGGGFRLLKSQTITVPALGVPDAPILSLQADGENISSAWTAVSGATGYKLFYQLYIKAEQLIGFLDMGSTTQLSVKLPKGTAFNIAILAYNQHGESGLSNSKYHVIK